MMHLCGLPFKGAVHLAAKGGQEQADAHIGSVDLHVHNKYKELQVHVIHVIARSFVAQRLHCALSARSASS